MCHDAPLPLIRITELTIEKELQDNDENKVTAALYSLFIQLLFHHHHYLFTRCLFPKIGWEKIMMVMKIDKQVNNR